MDRLLQREVLTSSVAGLLGVTVLYVTYKVIYNLYLHPLSKFPGPKLAAISNIRQSVIWIVGGRYPHDLHNLHKKYGDVVRIAPNELSFSTAQSFQEIYGHVTKTKKAFLKTEFYDRIDDHHTMFTERDPAIHREIRRSLSHAFSARALRDQEEVVLKYVSMFMTQLRTLGDNPRGINLNEWYNWLTFDIIGDLAFGESFGAIENAKTHPWVGIILDGAFFASVLVQFKRVPLLKLFAPFILPKDLKANFAEHWKRSQELAIRRMAKPNDRYDFFSHLLSDKAFDITVPHLVGEANDLVLAGSETTASFLAATTYYLLHNSQALQRLKDEVRKEFKNVNEITGDSTQRLQYLLAVTEEGLRIFPPAAFNLPRYSQGTEIDGYFIPEGAVVSTATYSVARQERYWFDPDGFHPERWLTETHPFYDHRFDNDNKNASKPFSTGSRACIGINLAYMEMRIILATLLFNFDLELISKNVDWVRDSRMNFLWTKPELMVRVIPLNKETISA